MSPVNKREGDWARALRESAPYIGTGVALVAPVLLGLAIGHWVDGKLGTEPWFFLVGAGFGLLSAGYHFYYTVVKARRP
jgi:F0F1-type ATP synthase assembly protein I